MRNIPVTCSVSILSVIFFYNHNSDVFQRVMRLVKVVSYWSIQSSMSYIGPVP